MATERRKSGRDRRSSSRVSATFAVKQQVGDEVQLCQAEDIAPGGITIKRPKDSWHQPKTTVALDFYLPGSGEQISAAGVVVSDATAGSFRRTGVRFIALRPEHEQLIAHFCRRQVQPRAARAASRSKGS